MGYTPHTKIGKALGGVAVVSMFIAYITGGLGGAAVAVGVISMGWIGVLQDVLSPWAQRLSMIGAMGLATALVCVIISGILYDTIKTLKL